MVFCIESKPNINTNHTSMIINKLTKQTNSKKGTISENFSLKKGLFPSFYPIKKGLFPKLVDYFFNSFVTFSLRARSGFGAGAKPIFVSGKIMKYSGKVRTS